VKGGGWGGLWIRGLAGDTAVADCDSITELELALLFEVVAMRGSFSEEEEEEDAMVGS
jgi:hypothetical protein